MNCRQSKMDPVLVRWPPLFSRLKLNKRGCRHTTFTPSRAGLSVVHLSIMATTIFATPSEEGAAISAALMAGGGIDIAAHAHTVLVWFRGAW